MSFSWVCTSAEEQKFGSVLVKLFKYVHIFPEIPQIVVSQFLQFICSKIQNPDRLIKNSFDNFLKNFFRTPSTILLQLFSGIPIIIALRNSSRISTLIHLRILRQFILGTSWQFFLEIPPTFLRQFRG